MKQGDLVKFKHPIENGDESLKFVLLENPDGGRVLVEAVVEMNLRPTYRYSINDLELVSKAN